MSAGPGGGLVAFSISDDVSFIQFGFVFIRRAGAPGDGGVMDLHFSREDMTFRDQARTWLRDNLIRERRPHSGEAMRSFDLAWQR